MTDREYEKYLRRLAERRAPAATEAARLLREDRYDAAERAIREVDDSIYGAVEIATLYRQRLEQLVADGTAAADRPRVTALFQRAVMAARGTFPEPHTAMEAEQNEEGRAWARAELVRILGFDPE